MDIPVRIAVAVVVAQQVVLLAGGIMGNLEGLIDGRQQLLRQLRHEINKTSQVILNVGRRHAAHEV